MKNLNIIRLILAGLVSGIIIYAFESVVNGVILANDWKIWETFAAKAFAAPSMTTSLTFWFLQSLIAGMIGVFVYAGIRQWIGVNLRAAYVSGLIVWATGWLGSAMDKVAMGVEMPKTIDYNVLGALLGCLAGSIAASFIYKDKAE